MPMQSFEICDLCKAESEPHQRYSHWGWTYIGISPKKQGQIVEKIICPKCTSRLKEWLKQKPCE
jgi:hypothetical protein